MLKPTIYHFPNQVPDMLAGHMSPVLFVLILRSFKVLRLPLQVGPRSIGKEFGAREMTDTWAQADGEKASAGFPRQTPRGPGSQKNISKLDIPALPLASPILSNGTTNPCYGVKLCTPLPAFLFIILHLRGKYLHSFIQVSHS